MGAWANHHLTNLSLLIWEEDRRKYKAVRTDVKLKWKKR